MPHGMGRSWFRTTRNHAIDALAGEEGKERTAGEAGMAGTKKAAIGDLSGHWSFRASAE
jgi:hypothetical protein